MWADIENIIKSTTKEISAEEDKQNFDRNIDSQIGQHQRRISELRNQAQQIGEDQEVLDSSERADYQTAVTPVLENIFKQIDDEYDKFIKNVYTQMGYTDVDSFYEDFSVEGYEGSRYFELAYRTEKALDYLVENCVVSFEEPPLVEDVEVTDDEAVQEDATEESAE